MALSRRRALAEGVHADLGRFVSDLRRRRSDWANSTGVLGYIVLKGRLLSAGVNPAPDSFRLSDDSQAKPAGWVIDHDLPLMSTPTRLSVSCSSQY